MRATCSCSLKPGTQQMKTQFSVVVCRRTTCVLTCPDLRRISLGRTMEASDKLSYKIINPPVQPTTFESVCISLTGSMATVIVLLVYRPGSADVTNKFFTELTAYLEVVALYKCQVVITGDFNIHVERPTDSDTIKLNEILDCFDCIQHTHTSRSNRPEWRNSRSRHHEV